MDYLGAEHAYPDGVRGIIPRVGQTTPVATGGGRDGFFVTH